MSDFDAGAVMGALLVFLMVVMVFMVFYVTDERIQAIAQCEAELPRHLNCEAVITARVKEGE